MKPDDRNKLDVVGLSTESGVIREVAHYASIPKNAKIDKTPDPKPVPIPVKKNLQNLVDALPKISPAFQTPVTVSLPKVPIYNIAGVKKVDNIQFEQFSADFARNRPKIYLIVDYVIDGVKIGNLIIFEKYKTASHYEIFKKNLFTETSNFQRVLFLTSGDLLQETTQYKTYIHDYIGLDNLIDGSYYVVMDPVIKEDRIYEYKILASRVPQNATEVDYDYILESKNLISIVDVDTVTKKTLSEFAIMTLGSKELAWTIALLNRNLQFFSSKTFLSSVNDIIKPDTKIIFPKSISHIKNIFNDSVSLFGIEQSINQLLDSLGGLTKDFKDSFFESLNKISKTFTYSGFIASARKKAPIFELILSITEHKNNASAHDRLSQLNIILPNKVGTENYTTIEGLSKIFDFVNALIFTIVRSQDNSDELQKLLRQLDTAPALPPAKPAAAPIVALNDALRNNGGASQPTRPATTIPAQGSGIGSYLRNNGNVIVVTKPTLILK